MSSTSVSVVVPLRGSGPAPALEAISAYLETTGFKFEVLAPSADAYGPALRRGVSDAKGSVVVIVDPELPYPVTAIGDAVALVESGATDVVFASAREEFQGPALTRWLLVPILPEDMALWFLRIGLIVAFGLHIHAAYSLTRINRRARGTGYESRRDYIAANYARRTMRVSGINVSLFLVGPLIDERYLAEIEYIVPAGCFLLAAATNFFYDVSLMTARREAACGPVDLTLSGLMIGGAVIGACFGLSWFKAWLTFSAVLPWIVSRPLARHYLLRSAPRDAAASP
jgi:hypothetical protein